MRRLFLAVVLFVFIFVAGCVTSEVDRKTRALNSQQLETLSKIQKQQAKIQAFVESFDAVERADVHFIEDGIRIGLYFKPGKFISYDEKEKINEFVIEETGLTKDKIKLPLIRR